MKKVDTQGSLAIDPVLMILRSTDGRTSTISYLLHKVVFHRPRAHIQGSFSLGRKWQAFTQLLSFAVETVVHVDSAVDDWPDDLPQVHHVEYIGEVSFPICIPKRALHNQPVWQFEYF